MSALGSPDSLLLSSSGGYEIERSLRFNDGDDAFLERTPSSAGNRKTWTWSAWLKRCTLGSDQQFFTAAPSGHASNTAITFLSFDPNDKLYFYSNWSGVTQHFIQPSQVFRDVSAWYHFVLSMDTTNATASERVKIYINGQRVTVFDTENQPGPDLEPYINAAVEHKLGEEAVRDRYNFDGYMAEVNFVDGTALDHTSFGKTDTETGAWIPKKYSGSYGTNGFYLSFSDNSSVSALGTDTSGRGNNWTVSPNFSVTPGVGNDSVTDSPTNNYPTLNPLDKTGGTMAQGNLTYTGVYSDVVTRNGHGARSTLKVPSSGKWYVEVSSAITSGIGNGCHLAFTSSEQRISDATSFGSTLTPYIGVDASGYNSNIYLRWAGVSGGTTHQTILFTSYAYGDIVNLAIDFDNGKFWVGHNGTWYNSGDPAAGTNATCTFTAGTAPWGFWAEYVASSDNTNRSQALVNFGQQGFEYTAPSGFLEMNTANLPVPTIKDGTDYFNTVLYTGNGSSGQDITTVGFQPDFVWLKKRSGGTARSHQVYDSVRGATKYLHTDDTSQEGTFTDSLDAFLPNGFSLAGGNDGTNGSTYPYVAWNWLAGGSTESLSTGTITSTVSRNVDAGFSIVTYTGNGTNPGTNTVTVGHGLGAEPAFIITKKRSSGTTDYGWSCWHKDLGAGYGIWLHSTSGKNAAMWTGDTNHSSTVFSPAVLNYNNESGQTYVNYVFAEVEGYSKFGSYTGNGSSDGPYVFCGFRPAVIWTKRADGTSNWYEFDDKRNPYNLTDNRIELNSNAAEYDGYNNNHDLLSNGFKLRSSDAGSNGSGGTYIFAAWAVNPFKYSNAR